MTTTPTTPTTTTTTPPSTPVIHGPVNFDYLNESWCELQYKSGCSSTGSISHLHHSVNPEVLEKLLQEAQKELPSPPSSLYEQTYEEINQVISPSTCITDSCTFILSASGNHNDKSTLLVPVIESYELNDSISITPIFLNSKQHLIHSDQECKNCRIQKQKIEMLLEKHQEQEVQIFNLKKAQDNKFFTKTPELTPTQSTISSITDYISTRSSNATNSPNKNLDSSILLATSTTSSHHMSNNSPIIDLNHNSTTFPGVLAAALRYQSNNSISVSSLSHDSVSNQNKASNFDENKQLNFEENGKRYSENAKYSSGNINSSNETTDWMKFFSSRPQIQPPKEWHFIHPNSSKSKHNLLKIEDQKQDKVKCRENIGKLIFTHMASFIVGATLMFLVLRKHFNIRSSICFV